VHRFFDFRAGIGEKTIWKMVDYYFMAFRALQKRLRAFDRFPLSVGLGAEYNPVDNDLADMLLKQSQ
jgi:hypothetical protein